MKLTQQLGYSYSANRRAADPLQLHVTSVGGQMKSRLDKIGDYSSWDVSRVHYVQFSVDFRQFRAMKKA